MLKISPSWKFWGNQEINVSSQASDTTCQIKQDFTLPLLKSHRRDNKEGKEQNPVCHIKPSAGQKPDRFLGIKRSDEQQRGRSHSSECTLEKVVAKATASPCRLECGGQLWVLGLKNRVEGGKWRGNQDEQTWACQATSSHLYLGSNSQPEDYSWGRKPSCFTC